MELGALLGPNSAITIGTEVTKTSKELLGTRPRSTAVTNAGEASEGRPNAPVVAYLSRPICDAAMLQSSQTSGFGEWLFSEAGAGWVFGLVSAAVLLISFIRRKRPQRIVVRELHRTTLVRIRPDVRRRIDVSFDGMRVNNLGELELEIVNDGSETIRDAHMTVTFPEGTRILETSQDQGMANIPLSIHHEANALRLSVPYLNAYRDHGHRLVVGILLDGASQDPSVRGSGDGWSVTHVRVPGVVDVERSLRQVMAMLVAVLIIGLLYAWLLFRYRGIGPTEVSWRSLFWSLPFLVLMVLTLAYGARRMRVYKRALIRRRSHVARDE
jgi:hypothetical protein